MFVALGGAGRRCAGEVHVRRAPARHLSSLLVCGRIVLRAGGDNGAAHVWLLDVAVQ